MSNKRKAIAGALALGAVTVAGAYTINAANAQYGSGNYPAVVDKLVERFNLNKDDVQSVFDENREERRTQNQERYSERLDQAVADGKLTEAQKQAILEKREELQKDWEEMQNLSWEERKEHMEEHRDEMQNWLDEQGIDGTYMMLGGMNQTVHAGGGPRGGFGHGGMGMEWDK